MNKLVRQARPVQQLRQVQPGKPLPVAVDNFGQGRLKQAEKYTRQVRGRHSHVDHRLVANVDHSASLAEKVAVGAACNNSS